MNRINLVTGANGHLGNNLVRHLLAKGEKVKAGVRDLNNKKPFTGLNCELSFCDLLDPQSLGKALEGVEILYQCAAVYKRWAKDPKREIYDTNIIGTKNIIQAAAKAGVRKIVYVSSIAALDHSVQPLSGNTWNTARLNLYDSSKADAEKLAWKLCGEYGIEMVSILPSAIIGGHFFSLTPTLKPFQAVLKKEMPFDPNISLLYIGVEDLAKACYKAVESGRPGERYIVSYEQSLDSVRLFQLAKDHFPELKLKVPQMASRFLLMMLATAAEFVAKLSSSAPVITRSDVKSYYGLKEYADTSNTIRDLQLELEDEQAVITKTFQSVKEGFFS